MNPAIKQRLPLLIGYLGIPVLVATLAVAAKLHRMTTPLYARLCVRSLAMSGLAKDEDPMSSLRCKGLTIQSFSMVTLDKIPGAKIESYRLLGTKADKHLPVQLTSDTEESRVYVASGRAGGVEVAGTLTDSTHNLFMERNAAVEGLGSSLSAHLFGSALAAEFSVDRPETVEWHETANGDIPSDASIVLGSNPALSQLVVRTKGQDGIDLSFDGCSEVPGDKIPSSTYRVDGLEFVSQDENHKPISGLLKAPSVSVQSMGAAAAIQVDQTDIFKLGRGSKARLTFVPDSDCASRGGMCVEVKGEFDKVLVDGRDYRISMLDRWAMAFPFALVGAALTAALGWTKTIRDIIKEDTRKKKED